MNELLMSGVSRWMGGALTGVYQGLLVAGAAWGILRILKRSNAATRHAVAFAALLGIAVLPVVQGGRTLWERHGMAGAVTVGDAGPAVGSGIDLESAVPPSANLASGEVRRDGGMLPPRAAGTDFEVDDSVRAESGGDVPPEEEEALGAENLVGVEAGEAREAGEDEIPGLAVAAAGASFGTPGDGAVGRPDRGSDWSARFRAMMARLKGADWTLRVPSWGVVVLMTAWGVLAGWRLVRLFRQYAILRQLRRVAAPAPEVMQAEFRRVASELGVKSSLFLGVSAGLNSPILVGCRRPAVLVPASFGEGGREAWTPVFLHELAHVRRGDAWSNLLQQTLAALYFFHPGVTWLSRRLSAEREIACDDHVLAAQGAPRAYALFLTEHARRMQGPDWAAAPAAWSNPSQLKERIHMLLDNERNASPRLARMRAGAWTTSVLLVALLAFHAAPRVSVAGAAAASPGPAEEPTGTTEPAPATVVDAAEVEGAPAPTPTTSTAPVDVLTEVRVDTEVDDRPKVKVREVRLTGPGGDVLVVAPAPPTDPLDRVVLAPPAPVMTPAPGPIHAARPVELRVMPPAPPTPALTVRPGRVVARLDETKSLRNEGAEDSLERRLDRLERLVESLVGERRARSKDAPDFQWKSGKTSELQGWEGKDAEKIRERVREIEVRAREQANELRKRVEDQVQRAGRQDSEDQRQIAEKAMRDALRDADRVQRDAVQAAEKALAKLREEYKPERRAELRRPLEEHRRVIEREMRRMEAQLDQLGSQLEMLDEESERIEELSEEVFERSNELKERRPEVRVTEERREELPPAKKKEKAPDAPAKPTDPGATSETPAPVRR